MNMAALIAARRKEMGMTQKQLADKLGVTDKAVSKWERGNGHPDIGSLEPLAAALDITVSELLRGEVKRPAQDAAEPDADDQEGNPATMIRETLDYVQAVHKDNSRKISRIAMFSFLSLGLAGIITTSIVDFAMNGRFTWSLLPIAAIVFSWLCIAPLLSFSKRGVDVALVSTSVFIIPFLYVLSLLIGGDWFRPIAIPMSICGMVLLWLFRAIFATKQSIWNKLAASMLVAAAGNVVIAFVLEKPLSGEGFDVWNLMSVAILVVAAIVFFAMGRVKKGRQDKEHGR